MSLLDLSSFSPPTTTPPTPTPTPTPTIPSSLWLKICQPFLRRLAPALFLTLALIFAAPMTFPLFAEESSEYERVRMSFTNFIRCELTRTNATDHFKGKPFKITMVSLFDTVQEGDILIVTGAVDCFVIDKHVTLYVALGVRTLMDQAKVDFFVVRKQDFTILATELMRYPYKERCAWTQYWIDLN
jgi:hypothetical protein